jgi:class 3 adenylate cyclase
MNKEKGKILIVDDDESVLMVSKYLLSQQFTEVITLDDPELLDDNLKSNSIDVALLDMNYTIGATTGEEGLNLLRTFKKEAPSTRIIMMTAYSDLDIAIRAIKEGADDFIVKPWDNDKFLSIVLSAYKMGPNISPGIKPQNTYPTNISKHKNEMKEVERVFMFLDIVSATTIAEKLGHLKYFELLKDFFDDLADPINTYHGEIYQYVGDEVVISWPLDKGIENGNCLSCFFGIADVIKSLEEKYLHKYQLVPGFKAGIHCGKVITGMVGSFKREVVYTGDVLNTTSRIEGQCNHYGVNLLFSDDLKEKITSLNGWEYKEIGRIKLRGKKADTRLYTCLKAE